MPNSEPGHEQPKITVLFGPFSANEVEMKRKSMAEMKAGGFGNVGASPLLAG